MSEDEIDDLRDVVVNGIYGDDRQTGVEIQAALDALNGIVTACTERDVEITRLRTALEGCVQSDLTHYEHHQPRRDGREPKEDGGTIWLTPREIANYALREKS